MKRAAAVASLLLLASASEAQVIGAVEYYHAEFDHYFITALTTEIFALDAGRFKGWQRTGQTLKVNARHITGGRVCRFFSDSFSPKSSHFYTSSEQECFNVRMNMSRDWIYEGDVFSVESATPSGACNWPGTIPVYRLYNLSKGGAPNHRYTTSTAIRQQMINQGWIPEGAGLGVVFCAYE